MHLGDCIAQRCSLGMLDDLPHLRIIRSLEGRALLVVAGLATIRIRFGDHARLPCSFLVFLEMDIEVKASRTMTGLTLDAHQFRFYLSSCAVTGDMTGQALRILLLFGL